MKRTLFSEEHTLFRKAFQSFIEREVVPHQERWREQGIVDREAWRKAGEGGFLCPWVEPEHGGAGGDFLHSVVVMEELALLGKTSILHDYMARRAGGYFSFINKAIFGR